MPNCQFIKRSGNVCNRKSSGVRCDQHRGKRNKLRRKGRRSGRKIQHTSSSIRFYDVSTGKIISVPRKNCRLRRSSGRGGDQVFTNYTGRKLFTFVPRGFEL